MNKYSLLSSPYTCLMVDFIYPDGWDMREGRCMYCYEIPQSGILVGATFCNLCWQVLTKISDATKAYYCTITYSHMIELGAFNGI